MADEKFLDKKMDRREFLKKAGIGGAGLALGLSGASAFFANQDSSSKKAYDGDEDISFYGKHQAGITTAMQKACYLVVVDLHTTDKKEVIQLFKDWTDYSSKLVEGELVKKDGSNALLPPTDTGETVGLNPYRLSLTFGVSASFLKKLGLESKRPKLFRDLPPFPKEQLQDKYTGGDIVIQACADDEQVAFHAVRNLIRKGRNTITMKWSKSGFAAIGDRKETPLDKWDVDRKRAVAINAVLIIVLSVPCILGFNVWQGVQFPGIGDIQSLEDFIVSNNVLPLGGLVYVLFCTSRYGWGWKNFLTEANTGAGPRFPKWAHAWIAYGIPALMVVIFIMGYIPKFQIWFGL